MMSTEGGAQMTFAIRPKSGPPRPSGPGRIDPKLLEHQLPAPLSTIPLSIRTKGVSKEPPARALAQQAKTNTKKKSESLLSLARKFEAATLSYTIKSKGIPNNWFAPGPKRTKTQLRRFFPTIEEAHFLIDSFGDLAFHFDPQAPNAHINPWVFSPSGSRVAALPSSSQKVAVFRMRGNVAAANFAIQGAIAAYNERPEGEDETFLVDELLDQYEIYFNRRTTLLMELQLLKAKKVAETWKDGWSTAQLAAEQ